MLTKAESGCASHGCVDKLSISSNDSINRMKKPYLISIIVVAAIGAAVIGYVVVGSQEPHAAPSGVQEMDHGSVAGNPAVEAYREANARMHEAMSAPGTGDADRDFAAAMIAHHQGAIDMAHILLRYGRDPELRALAEDIIGAQQGEIEFLRRWLAEHPE